MSTSFPIKKNPFKLIRPVSKKLPVVTIKLSNIISHYNKITKNKSLKKSNKSLIKVLKKSSARKKLPRKLSGKFRLKNYDL